MIQPFLNRTSGMFGQLKLHRPSGLLLNNHCSNTKKALDDDVADTQFHEIAAAKFAFDREIEQRKIADHAFVLKMITQDPDLFRLERRLGADLPSLVSRRHGVFADKWRNIDYRTRHCRVPAAVLAMTAVCTRLWLPYRRT